MLQRFSFKLPFILLIAALSGCDGEKGSDSTTGNTDSLFVAEHYTKTEYRIPMRDGVELHTVVYAPKDITETDYPIMLKRTPYNCAPYGEKGMKSPLGPSRAMMRDKYIFVYQDVRGRFMSEGTFLNMTPHLPQKKDSTVVDESSDTYDTIDWLTKHITGNNGKVGLWGISYPGFYAAAGAIDAHPALVCSSPQAPIADWYWDDFHHHGAFFLPHAFGFLSSFGQPRDSLHQDWPSGYNFPTTDGYGFYLDDMGALSNVNAKYYKNNIAFWDSIIAHPNYDDFWQRRNILPHLNNMQPAMMTVGGWYDAEDLYGPLNIYQTMEQNSPQGDNMLVMGPWRHGGWARDSGYHHGNVYFGEQATSIWYQEEVELPWFSHYLKGTEKPDLPEALMFNTGANEWRRFEQWPPANIRQQKWTLSHSTSRGNRHQLALNDTNTAIKALPEVRSVSFVSDPNNPVPYTADFATRMTREYMSDDQRFASRRPDVLVWESEVLREDLTISGPLLAHLTVSTTGTAADWVVKVIDVYPDTTKNHRFTAPHQTMGGYQQMVRSEVIRGRYRNSYEQPEPFVPNTPTVVKLPLQDVCHTFKKGHRIMIHVQSSWFPMVDRNPQVYTDNIFEAPDSLFTAQTHAVFVNGASYITVGVE